MIYLEKWRQGEKLFTFVWMWVLAVFSRGWGVGRGECDGNFSLKDHAQNLDSRWKLDEQFFERKMYEKMAETIWDWIFMNFMISGRFRTNQLYLMLF